MPCGCSAPGMGTEGLERSEFCRKVVPVCFETLVGFVLVCLDALRRFDVPRDTVAVADILSGLSWLRSAVIKWLVE